MCSTADSNVSRNGLEGLNGLYSERKEGGVNPPIKFISGSFGDLENARLFIISAAEREKRGGCVKSSGVVLALEGVEFENGNWGLFVNGLRIMLNILSVNSVCRILQYTILINNQKVVKKMR